MDEKKVKRRTSKTRFTRQRKVFEQHVKQDSSIEELTEEFQKFEVSFMELQNRQMTIVRQ